MTTDRVDVYAIAVQLLVHCLSGDRDFMTVAYYLVHLIQLVPSGLTIVKLY